MAVKWIWTAGLLSDSADVTVALTASPATSLRIGYSTDASFTGPVWTSPLTATSNGYFRQRLTGLTPDTRYYIRAEIDGATDGSFTASLKTWPIGDGEFSLSFASCNESGADHPVFEHLIAEQLPFFHLGDKGYLDVSTNTPSSFIGNHEGNLASPSQREWHRTCPVEYIWDDHDFGTDNSNGSSASKPAAEAAFRELVPSHGLVNSVSGDLRRSWTVRGVRFILTDLRYNRSPSASADSPTKTMLGADQLAWFLDEIDDAHADDCRLIVWLNTNAWTGGGASGDSDGDHWGTFTYERKQILSHLRANEHPPVVILAGDAHMLAAQNRRERDTQILILQSAALANKDTYIRGTDWDIGPFDSVANAGQYSTVTIGEGPSPSVRWQAYRVSAAGARSLLADRTWWPRTREATVSSLAGWSETVYVKDQ